MIPPQVNNSYSLALGGGAARGLCHIGVLKYLEEKNIRIEEITGTSMGAVIGACFSIGMASKEIENITKNINFLKLIDINLKTGIVSGNKIYAELEKIYGDSLIEKTKIPLRIIATDEITGEKYVFKKGKILDAVRASISIPIVLSVCDKGKKKYLDGGLIENLPVLELKGENIIAVSAIREQGKQMKTSTKIGKFEFKKGFFGYNYEILKRTITIALQANENLCLELAKEKGKNIIILRPNITNFEYYSFNKVTEIIQKGYDEAKVKLHNL